MRIMTVGVVLIAAVVTGQAELPAQVATKVMIRVVSHDAKVIGSGVGGARVTVREVETGKLLASGVQEGGTGSTDLIMRRPRERGRPVYEAAGAAGFLAELMIGEPTRVEIVGEGPLGTPEAIQRTTKTMLVVPGEDVLGEGVILELNGFTVVIDSLPDGVEHGRPVPVIATVTMLCGCPFSPGGLWDSDRISVVAEVLHDGRSVSRTPLSYAGPGSKAGLEGGRSSFGGWLTLDEPGDYQIRVLAKDPERGNFGVSTRSISVR